MRCSVLLCALATVGCDRVLGLTRIPDGSVVHDDAADDAPRPDGEPAGCPASYDRILQTTASRYRLVLSGKNWAGARATCAQDKPGLTHLLVLSNENEWRAFITDPPSYLANETWIGFSDRVVEGTFRWVTNEVTPYASVGQQTPWEADQPETGTSAPTDDCVAMRALAGLLHDDGCSSTHNYICECDGIIDNPAN